MNIVQLLKNRRQELGISQDKLANHIGFTHRSTIHRLEQGHIEWKFEKVVKACELLKLEITIKEKKIMNYSPTDEEIKLAWKRRRKQTSYSDYPSKMEKTKALKFIIKKEI